MKLKTLIASFFLFLTSSYAVEGMRVKQSVHSVEVTATRFEEAARKKGMNVFPRVDHREAALKYSKEMPPAVVLSVGNPKYGTKFMLKNPQAAIDFPPKALVYQDSKGDVYLAYNTAEYLYKTVFPRHGLEYDPKDLPFYRGVLEELTNYAAGPVAK